MDELSRVIDIGDMNELEITSEIQWWRHGGGRFKFRFQVPEKEFKTWALHKHALAYAEHDRLPGYAPCNGSMCLSSFSWVNERVYYSCIYDTRTETVDVQAAER